MLYDGDARRDSIFQHLGGQLPQQVFKRPSSVAERMFFLQTDGCKGLPMSAKNAETSPFHGLSMLVKVKRHKNRIESKSILSVLVRGDGTRACSVSKQHLASVPKGRNGLK
jgi:hypothetical protein